MKDLTQGSVTKHLLHMSAFMAVSIVVQTLYLLADLFWVGRLGKEAIAAVGVAGNLTMIVLALTQMLGVGTTALISQAAGRKDQPHAELVFNQSCAMSIWIAVALGGAGFFSMDAYANSLSADPVTAGLAKAYLVWFLPAMLLQVPVVTVCGIIRNLGPAAQAGCGVGGRVMHALFLPVVALRFAVSPLVGQNFGGRRGDRVRHSVKSGLGLAAAMMLVLAVITEIVPGPMIRFFSNDADVIAFGSDYLRIVAFNFVAAGIVFTSSSMFQGLGNTVPTLLSSASRLVHVALPSVY